MPAKKKTVNKKKPAQTITQLTPGSRYLVYTATSRDELYTAEGVFQGFLTIGDEVALCMELGNNRKKRTRIIPLSVILAIDVIKAVDEVNKKDDTDNDKTLYFN